MSPAAVIFEQVEILRVIEFGFWCRIDGRELFVGRNVPQAGTTIRLQGDRGRLVLPTWFAIDQGLPTR